MDTETNPERPLVQIDDEVRPMTDEEYNSFLAITEKLQNGPSVISQ